MTWNRKKKRKNPRKRKIRKNKMRRRLLQEAIAFFCYLRNFGKKWFFFDEWKILPYNMYEKTDRLRTRDKDCIAPCTLTLRTLENTKR